MLKGIRLDEKEVMEFRQKIGRGLGVLCALFVLVVGSMMYGAAATAKGYPDPLTWEENVAAESDVSVSPESSDAQCPLEEEISGGILVNAKWERTRGWCDLIVKAASHYGLDPHLLASLILWESGGDPLVYSHDGAVGLMQVMPRDGRSAEFMCINGPCFANRPSTEELQDPAFNIDYGSNLLREKIERGGSIRDGLRLYGPKDIGYYYADKILELYERIRP